MSRKERRRKAKDGAAAPSRDARQSALRGATALGPPALLARAIELHQQGKFDEAEGIYRRVLALAPREPDALHFLGLLAHQKGDDARAIELMGQAIALDGEVAVYHSNLGESYRALGRFAEAIACYREALRLRPALAAARFGLGTALLEEKAFEAAAAELQAALEADPNDAEARLNLGNALVELGRSADAIAEYERALALKPAYAEAHLNLGLALKAGDDLRAAYGHFMRAVELTPRLPEAHYQLGTILLALERQSEATRAFRQAVALRPEMVDALLQLGLVLRLQHEFDEARQCYERARALDPGSIEPLNGIGHTFLEQGRFEDARSWFMKALERRPDAAVTCMNLGLSYQLQGRFEEGAAWHEKAIERQPDFGGAHYNLALSRKSESRDARIEELERVLAMDRLAAEQRIGLAFALAKLYDDLGDYDAAFRHYKAGNDLKKIRLPFRPEEFTAYIDRVIAIFSKALFETKGPFGDPTELPVFIVGMPRSGTTLVEQILASHPAVHGAGELDYMRQIAAALPQRLGSTEPYPECAKQLDERTAKRIAKAHLGHLLGHAPAAARITDKLPNNFQRLGLIALLFPRARLIHCVRDPLDTCLSCYFQEFAHGQPYAYDLGHLGRYFREYQRLMAHWHATLPSPILDVPYEALIADQEGWSRKLVDFLGLPWDDRCLAFYETDRLVRTASFWQVRQPIYASSVGRWRRYAGHLGPLFEGLGMAPPDD